MVYVYFVFGWVIDEPKLSIPFNAECGFDHPISSHHEVAALEDGIRQQMLREKTISSKAVITIANFQLLREVVVGKQD